MFFISDNRNENIMFMLFLSMYMNQTIGNFCTSMTCGANPSIVFECTYTVVKSLMVLFTLEQALIDAPISKADKLLTKSDSCFMNTKLSK